MEPVENPVFVGEAGDKPASKPTDYPLYKEHDDLDVLSGCPRTLLIQDVPVTTRAFRNHEFSQFAEIVLYYGFSGIETEADVDKVTIEDIYTGIAINSSFLGSFFKGVPNPPTSVEAFLWSYMKFPDDIEKKPEFYDITKDEFQKFLAVLIEQNNLMKIARVQAKKKMGMIREMAKMMAESGRAIS